jgi:hypothetical protein
MDDEEYRRSSSVSTRIKISSLLFNLWPRLCFAIFLTLIICSIFPVIRFEARSCSLLGA